MAHVGDTMWGRPVDRTERQYETQGDAIKAERQRVWGQENVRGCDYRPLPNPVVVWVGKRQFAIFFDNFGRVSYKTLVA